MVSALAATQAGLEPEVRAASAAKPKVAVGGFSGDRNGEARDAFLAALRKDGSYDITDADDIKSTANAKAVTEAARAMDVNVVITGKVSGSGVKLKVMDAYGKVQGEPEIKGAGRKKLKANIDAGAAMGISDAVQNALPEEPEKPAAAPADADAEKDKEEDSSSDEPGPALSPLDITVGLRGLHRTFEFHDTIAEARPGDGFGKFLKYKLPLGPVVFADLSWYPAAHFSKGQAARIGLIGGYEKGVAISTEYKPDGSAKKTLTTDEQAFYLGARYRLPLGPHELGAAFSFGQHTFALGGDEQSPLVPDVKYTYVKLGLDGTVRIGPVAIGARVGKRFVLSTGSLEDVWFPGSVKTSSLEAGATFGYRLTGALEAVVGFDWLRYAFDFNPVRKRAGFESAVAGGAQDQYLSGFLGLRLHWPVDNEASAAAATPAAKPDADEE
ncbi:MAG TPA: hypothetical protein VEQ58_03155 [Polyangiaceae bacterium]|nr:hypothetical protein [Polyangiaceae bacterium]